MKSMVLRVKNIGFDAFPAFGDALSPKCLKEFKGIMTADFSSLNWESIAPAMNYLLPIFVGVLGVIASPPVGG